MTPNPITCQELVELITEYLEDKLPAGERVRLKEHLALCAGCRTYVDQMRQTIFSTGRLRGQDLSERTQQELLDLFRNWKQAKTG